MGQEVVDSVLLDHEVPAAAVTSEPPAVSIKTLIQCYTKEHLLSFADLESCKNRPEGLDPVVWREAASVEGAEGGIAIPAGTSRGLVRRDSYSDGYSKSPQDLPEWRKDSWRAGGNGTPLPQRRKPYDDEPLGNAFSTSYPPSPASNWGENGSFRNSHERSGTQGTGPSSGSGSGQGRWEHRSGVGDREREKGRSFSNGEGEEAGSSTSSDSCNRSYGGGSPVLRPGWMPTERDGLLGSGGTLGRSFSTGIPAASSLRAPERHNSLGPERLVHITAERQNSLGPDRATSIGRMGRVNEPLQSSRSLNKVQSSTYARREDTDFVNDETFGSEETSSEDRAEQERKRRESFELMRKDHQRKLQEQQKIHLRKQEQRLANPDLTDIRKHDENSLWDDRLSSDIVQSSPPKSPKRSLKSDSKEAVLTSDLCATGVAPSTPRPAIPPGFAKIVQQMQVPNKPSVVKETISEGDSTQPQDSSRKVAETVVRDSAVLKDGSNADDNSLLPTKISEDRKGVIELTEVIPPELQPESVIPSTFATEESGISIEFGMNSGNQTEDIAWRQGVLTMDAGGYSDIKDNSSVGTGELKPNQESLLDELFSRAKSGMGPERDTTLPHFPAEEAQVQVPEDDAWSETDPKMSKFAQWFHHEEKHSKGRTGSNILSLFPMGSLSTANSGMPVEQINREPVQTGGLLFPPRNSGRILPMPVGPSLEDIEKGLTESANASMENDDTSDAYLLISQQSTAFEIQRRGATRGNLSGHSWEHEKTKKQVGKSPGFSKTSPVFLTCEDIEQSLLAEAGNQSRKTVSKAPHMPGSMENTGSKTSDSAASRLLLSLLQKKDSGGKKNLQFGTPTTHGDSFGFLANASAGNDGIVDNSEYGQSSATPDKTESGKVPAILNENSTLEALFGKAFMSELRSVEAPVSTKTFTSDSGNVEETLGTNHTATSRVSNAGANTSISRPWFGTIGPISRTGWTDDQGGDPSRPGPVTDLTFPVQKGNHFIVQENENIHLVSSTSGEIVWGNTGGSLENDMHALGDNLENSRQGKGHVSSTSISISELNNLEVSGQGEISSTERYLPNQMQVTGLDSPITGQMNALSRNELKMGVNTQFDLSGNFGLSKVVMSEDNTVKMLAGENTTGKHFIEEHIVPGNETLENFLLKPYKVDRKERPDDGIRGKGFHGDDRNSGMDKQYQGKMTDSLSEALGFIGKGKDINVRASNITTAGSDQGNLSRANSLSNGRFKTNMPAMQPPSGFSAFQQVAPLQQQQSVGSMYRSEPPASLQRQQSGVPLHHHLQQSANLGNLAVFPHQAFRQPGIPQQPQIVAPTYGNGNPMDFPHVPFGHVQNPPSRTLPTGHLHFQPSPHGHMSPPGAFHPMNIGPTPTHFLSPGQIPRGPVLPGMADHLYIQEQQLHDPHGLNSKPGPQQGPNLFPLPGHSLHSGQGPMFHQPLGPNLRGPQSQLIPGQPWLPPYASEFMRNSGKGHDAGLFVNGSGGVGVGGGGAMSLDRWFGMELSRNLSGIPNPGLMQLSPQMESENKMRFG